MTLIIKIYYYISKLRCCTNNPDLFCYISGEYDMKDQRKRINDTVIRLYSAYFGIEKKGELM